MVNPIQRPNPETVAVVNKERRRLHEDAILLDAQMKELTGNSDLLSQFTNADLANSAGSFAFQGLAEKFVGKYSITKDDLKLTEDEVRRLPVDTEEQRNKRENLLHYLRCEAFASEIRQKQALWQARIFAGTLLPEDARTNVVASGAGLSVEDLQRLDKSTESLKVLDEDRFPAGVTVALDNGKPYFTVNSNTTHEDIAKTVEQLAATGSKTITINCKHADDLPQYNMMIEQSLETILLNGYDMEIVVNSPFFLTASSKNTDGEPSWIFDRADYRKGKADEQFWQDVVRNKPKGSVAAADPAANFAAIYAGLMPKHKERFLQWMFKSPSLRPQLSAMAEHFIRTGNIEELTRLRDDAWQYLNTNKKILEAGIEEAIVRQVRNGMNALELNHALDQAFDHTKASKFNFGNTQQAVVELMVAVMSPNQLQNYAHYLANHPDISQRKERIGMILAHCNPAQSKEFVKAFLDDAYKKACEERGIKPGIKNQIPNPAVPPVPPTIDEPIEQRRNRCVQVEADVQKAWTDMFAGITDYAGRVGLANAKPLARAAAFDISEFAGKNIDDMATLYPGIIDPAARGRYINEAKEKAVNARTAIPEFQPGYQPQAFTRRT